MSSKINEKEVIEFMSKMSADTKVYLGADSEKIKKGGKTFALVTTVIVVHIDGCKGCKVFAETSLEPDWDKDPSKPYTRMMMEAQKVAELHDRFKDILYDYEVSIHLDISRKKTCGSNVALESALGYVQGVTGIKPLAKPFAPSASYAADRAVGLGLTN